MNFLKKYYAEICNRKREELKARYSEENKTSYRWQDIVAEATGRKIEK